MSYLVIIAEVKYVRVEVLSSVKEVGFGHTVGSHPRRFYLQRVGPLRSLALPTDIVCIVRSKAYRSHLRKQL